MLIRNMDTGEDIEIAPEEWEPYGTSDADWRIVLTDLVAPHHSTPAIVPPLNLPARTDTRSHRLAILVLGPAEDPEERLWTYRRDACLCAACGGLLAVRSTSREWPGVLNLDPWFVQQEPGFYQRADRLPKRDGVPQVMARQHSTAGASIFGPHRETFTYHGRECYGLLIPLDGSRLLLKCFHPDKDTPSRACGCINEVIAAA